MNYLGFDKLAEKLLAKFKWGLAFPSLNQELLESYAACSTSAEVVAVQEKVLAKQSEDHDQNKTKGPATIALDSHFSHSLL